MRGMGQVQKLAMKEAKSKIFSYILKNQPSTYKEIQKNSHVRRNRIRQYISELETENKITKINSNFYENPPPSHLLEKEKRSVQIINFLETCSRNFYNCQFLLEKIHKLENEQPKRYEIINNKLRIELDLDFMKTIDEYQNKIDLENLSSESLRGFFDNALLFEKHVSEFFDEWGLRQRLVTRFEYPRFKNIYDNPFGIKPKFRNKDGKVNYTKIERTYRFRIFCGLCLCCGEYVANYFNPQLEAHMKFQKGKITKEEYDEIINYCKKHRLDYKVIQETDECPRDFMFNGKPLPKDIIRIKKL